jgi:hypothetical protein
MQPFIDIILNRANERGLKRKSTYFTTIKRFMLMPLLCRLLCLRRFCGNQRKGSTAFCRNNIVKPDKNVCNNLTIYNASADERALIST